MVPYFFCHPYYFVSLSFKKLLFGPLCLVLIKIKSLKAYSVNGNYT